MNNYRTIQQKDMHKLFPHWGKNIPALGTKCSHTGNKTALRFALSLLLMMVPGVSGVWGQIGPVGTDYSGTYYIANYNDGSYNSADKTDNFYLCPASNYFDGDGEGKKNQPFLTTHKPDDNTEKETKPIFTEPIAKWEIEFATTGDDGVDYYYIKFLGSDGNEYYIVHNDQITNNKGRVRVHLQTTKDEDEDKNLFFITQGTLGDKKNLNLCPKAGENVDNSSLRSSLNPAKANLNNYSGQNIPNNNPGSFKRNGTDSQTIYCGGLVGYWTINDKTGVWYLEDVKCKTPEITYSSETGEVTITSTEGATIYYTIDGTTTPDPANAGGENTTQVYDSTDKPTISSPTTFKAMAVKQWMDNSEVATQSIEKLVDPSVTFVDATQKVTITTNSVVEGATSVYTTDGNDPIPSSTEYSEPISITEATTTVKAMTMKDGYLNSDVVSLTVTKLASSPSISKEGNTVTLSYTGDGTETIYYTTDGTTPTQGSSSYNAPFSLDGNQKYTIKAIAAKTGFLNSEVAEEVVDNRSSISAPTITYTGNTVTITASDYGDVVYYTTDGTTPTTDTETYFTTSGTFNLDNGYNYTIKAIASNGVKSSSIATETIDLTNSGYSGIYYFQNNADGTYYMYPVGGESALVKTAKKTDQNAIWKIERVGDYYHIIHYNDRKYLVAKDLVNGSMPDTETVSLVETDSPGENALFEITRKSGDESDIMQQIILIRPKAATNETSIDGHIYLNTRGGNDGTKTIGLYDDTGSSEWKLATVPSKPTFTVSDIKVTITNTFGAGTIHYTTDGTEPTSSSTSYSNPITLKYGPSYTVKAICVYHDDISGTDWTSEVATSSSIKVNLLNPIVTRSGNNVTITNSQASGVTFRYTFSDNGNDPADPVHGGAGTDYTTALSLTANARNVFKAIAYNTVGATTYKSNVVKFVVDLRGATTISSLADITSATGSYILSSGFSATGTPKEGDIEIGTNTNPFKGTIDGNLVEFELNSPLFDYVQDATIKNVIISKATISTSGNAGAIAANALGATRIYNCGVLATGSTVNTNDDGYTEITSCSSTISGGNNGNVGGIVGLLDGASRVINCFSYAKITGGENVGGIVGYNNVQSTSVNQATMVMNCMFYGDIDTDHTTNRAPIYNGKIITNRSDQNGVSNFNYFWAEASYVQKQMINTYNCALAAETRFLQRFEFFRPLLNSNRALAAWWATGSRDNKDEMLKWVMEPSQIGTATPYPILKLFAKYPSVVNLDADHAEEFSGNDATKKTQYNQGRKFGTFTIKIQKGSGQAGDNAPSNASITTPEVYPNITDKDPAHFNFNYYKVQLPYYNDVGTKNYTENKVVTGWKIVSMSKSAGSFTTGSDATATVSDGDITLSTPYNFADRKCTAKDIYSETNKRVFNQGAYFDVPEGVTSITIEPYWANCVYVSDSYPDVIYNQGMSTPANVTTVGGGQRYTNGTAYDINGSSQKVYTTMSDAVSALNPSSTVYDNAVVLVGNVHSLDLSNKTDSKPYTIMSIDLDKDNEPDYSYILRFNGRTRLHPVRVDFLNVIGLGMAQKSNGGTGTYNFGIMQPYGWFEATNTSLFRVTQFEYDFAGRKESPMILQGGVIEQWVTVGGSEESIKEAKSVSYYHVGGNVWFKEFHIGVHQDKTQDEFVSPHPPISVTGGDFDEFYLTGMYNTPDKNYDDNAECYINGGRFGKVAGTGMQGLGNAGGAGVTGGPAETGNIIWQIDNADIDEFYAGGINAAHIAEGNIYTVISNSRIDQFCGGPKFGDMNSNKKVVTNATNCTFRTFFGAGYGGNSYNRRYPQNKNNVTNQDWDTWVQGNDGLKYRYDGTYGGVETRIDYQFIPMSNNTSNVARLFVDHVSFSMATTYDVTSKLTGCIITTSPLGRLSISEGYKCLGSFYGGGSLGKVAGPVKSTLTNCKVDGNVYGAGYSATLPTVNVMKNSFKKQPKYDQNLGAYLEAELPETDFEYTWEHSDEVKNDATAIDKTNHILYTTEDLTALGKVTGTATLNIDGSTTVAGSVYGGGEESNVAGNTQVNITGGTITKNVFGGGKGSDDNFTCDKAMVGVNDDGACGDPASNENKDKGTKVTISNGTVNGNVYGGGEVGRVEWNTQVTIGAGEGTPIINGNVFGAGKGKETHGYAALVRGNSTVTVQGNAKVLQNVYGGGEQATVGRYWVKGILTTPCPEETQPTIPDGLPDGMPYHQRRGGICKVVIQGEAQIGPDEGGTEIAGHVFGAGKGVVPNFIASGEGASQKMIKGDENNPDRLVEFDSEDAYLEFLQTLALVTNTEVKIDGDAKVKGSVYGGSESGYVQHNTNVIVSGGTIGTADHGGAYYGNVYGGGKGDAEHTGSNDNYLAAGIVKGYTKVKIEGGTILHNIYGGGAYGSVGVFDYDTTSGLPTGLNANAPENSGKAEIHITGGTIGTTGEENGMIFGSSRGDVGAPGSIHDKLAWVYDTHVAIGDTTENAPITTAAPLIRGSIYGGGENGHNFRNAYVRINGGTIGIPSDATYAYRGNVYGGGCGTDKYDSDSDGNVDKYNSLAGIVQGNAFVNMTGGFVVHNVYGAGAMGSVGSVGTDTSGGKTTVSVSGGRIGYDGSNNGNVYGAARGDLAATGNLTQVRKTEVNISYTTTPAADNNEKTVQLIAGSVFGGGEAGTVKESVAVNMTGGLILHDVYGGGALAHTQTSNWNSTNNTWAEGKTSASNTTTVRLTGGTISGDAYGGGLGQKTGVNDATRDIPAYVYGDVLLDLNGTTSIDGNTHKPLTTGTATTNESGCAVSQIFGCNNINGSPKGDVMVHVYATQNKLTETIAKKFIREKDCDTEKEENETDEAYVNRLKGILTGKITFAEALDITVSQDNKDLATSQAATAADLKTAITNITTSIEAKTTAEINAARYDMVAVYGGGDMAAYNPVSPYAAQNTSGAKTQVIIEGCDETSIETVYGGGNAAAVPETNVVIKAAYEIQAVFGGGNGKDNLPNGDPNPGADIGTLDQGSSTYGTGNANSVLKGGYIHEAYGGSNTKGIVKGDLNQTSDPEGDCELILEKVVGAGKYADIDGDVNMTLSCQPSSKVPELFAGADEANVNGNITLNITNGHFGKVFGGNNLGGAVKGKITVNVEETGCQPIRIDELYLGGNEAAYSVYGYYESDEVHPVTEKKILKPRTSATDEHPAVSNPATDATHTFPYAQPELNIISCTSIGKVFGGGYGEGAMMYADPTVNINMIQGTATGSLSGIGTIGDVYGGGNAAKIIGNTTVNIGTDKTALGANITGNIYGGGNLADVTGNTFVNICAEYDNETEKFVAVAEGTSGVTIGGNVFGGGKGEAAESGDDAFLCARAMIGINNDGIENPDGGTTIIIGNGTVNGNVYGGGMFGRVEKNTVVTIGLEGTPTSEPEIIGNVYGGGQGEKHHGYAGLVRGNPTVTIQGDAKVRKSVYGGGEIASVARYKVAETPEEATAHGVEVGMPYVLANANSGKCTVTIKGNAEIGPETAMKMYHSEITDGTDKPDDFGHVFGAGKGILPEVFTYVGDDKPYRIDNDGNKESYDKEKDYFAFIQTLALSTDTHVTIDGNAFVKGSVYGGSENGLVQYDTYVTINSGQIGCGDGVDYRYTDDQFIDPTTTEVTESNALAECAHWDYGLDTNNDGKKDLFAPYDPNANATGDLDKYPKVDAQSEAKSTEGGRRIATDGHTYYGNVFGGGSGSVPYFDTQKGISRYISTAGEVKGNTHVTINGGHILTNVYGGNEATNVLGTASVTMTGGTVGVPRTAEQIKNHPVTCYVFGAGKGDQRIFFNKETNVNDAVVTITGGRIYGSVFGGGEDGHVLRNTTVTIGNNGTGPTIGTTGTTYVDGNVFGGGRGFGGDALSAGNVGGAVDLTINGGTMLGSIYGGGRLASVGYGLYLVDEVVDGVKPYGVMRDDNQYDGSYPNPSTEPASTFYNKGRGHITITINGGTIGKEFESETEGAEHSGNVFGGSMGRLTKLDGSDFDDPNHWKLLATAKSATINVTGGTIRRNVYGGGEMGTVTTNTTVNISGGTIGTTGKGADNYGNVYGGGKGLETEILAGIVKGNTNVTVSGGAETKVLHNVYGGGAYGSVGTFTISSDMRNYMWTDEDEPTPNSYTYNNTGVSSVTISGGTIGEDALNGNVFGGGRGVANTFWCEKGIAYKANVIISNGTVKGNVYGGGEVGRVETDTKVEIGSGTGEGTFAPNITGSVFGGGAGLETHGYSALVRGNTTVTIEGNAHVGNSVYGGGEIASVGKYGLDANEMPSILKGGGQCTVTVQGNASIGTDVFGAGKGVSPHFDKDNADETKRSRRMIVNEGNYVWEDFQNESDYLTYLTTLALATHPNVTINENATVGRSVFGGGEVGLTKGSVEVNILGGTIHEDVYGGGALADTNTTTTADLNDDGITEPVSPTTTVNLLGGTIGGDAYGGGLGQKIGFNGGTSDVEATVYGDITVNLGDENAAKATKFNINYENTGEKDEANNPISVVQSGRVFGCNNLNGSPQGNVTVNVYKTVEGNVARTAAEDPNAQEKRASRDANVSHTYELAAIYGGGNLADYTATGKKANVIIHTCDVSVQYVYGGGNAAAVPGTDVLVKGAWEIDHVFGGGNGKDMYKKGNEWILNAGANVTGNTNTLLIGGYIHEAYGGSNEKGTIGGNVTINTVANDPSCACALELTKLYGAGKNADIEGDLIVVLDCAPETKTEEIYGGAENANVKGNVELTITSGTFGKVFGGNNQSGAIFGHIVLNVEETSCRPIVIDELYGCGNNAAYSVYGYKDGGTDADGYPIYIPRTSKTDGAAVTFTGKPHTDPGEQGYDDPQVNIISCTSIGQVFGGGLGSGATVYGNPTVNIDQIYGKAYVDNDPTKDYTETATTLGVIGDVFGGGNAANVVGNTNVNIGTKDKVKLHLSVDGNGTYTYSEDKTVLGANITGNVYGGGNEAEVTGDTNVNIGKKSE